MIARPTRLAFVASFAVTALVGGTAFQVLRPKHLVGDGQAAPQAELVARLQQIVEELPAPRPVGSEALARAEELVAVRLRDAGYRVARQPVEHDGERSHNVVATRRSGMELGPLWVIGAHLDTVPNSPGADDNGSGVAIMLAVAERIAATRAAKHVIFVAFADEERGLLGSDAWLRSLSERDRREIDGVLVLDTLGFTSKARGSQRYPEPLGPLGPDVGDFLGCITLREHAGLLDAFVEARARVAPSLPLVTLAAPRTVAELVPDLWRSDHAPMWRSNIPAMLLTDTGNFRNPGYHGASDTTETLDFVFMAQVAETLIELLRAATPTFG